MPSGICTCRSNYTRIDAGGQTGQPVIAYVVVAMYNSLDAWHMWLAYFFLMYCEPLIADCPDHLVWLNDGILNQQVVHLLKNALQADVLMPINTLTRHQLCCTVCCAVSGQCAMLRQARGSWTHTMGNR